MSVSKTGNCACLFGVCVENLNLDVVFQFLFPTIFRMDEITPLDGDGNLHEEGEDEEPHGPDAEGDEEFEVIGHVVVDLAEGTGDKTGQDETGPFLDPDADYDEQAAQIERGEPFSRPVMRKRKKAVTLKPRAVHIQGTSTRWPSSPW